MDIVRIPKPQPGAVTARLVLTTGHNGDVDASLEITAAMSSRSSRNSYPSAQMAEKAAANEAERSGAHVLIIEDRT